MAYQPWVPVFVDETGAAVLPRRYAQSTSGRIVSQGTSPPDSRSIFTANDSPQVLYPYAMLSRCLTVVPHRSANAARSERDLPLRNSLSSIRSVHHTVLIRSTPNGEFTKRCESNSIPAMDSSELEELKKTRISNLKSLIQRDYAGNAAALGRDCKKLPQYINDLVGGRKSFGEKAVMGIEAGAGLLRGQLSITNSPLLRDPSRSGSAPASIDHLYHDLDEAAKRDAFEFIMQLKSGKRRRGRRAS